MTPVIYPWADFIPAVDTIHLLSPCPLWLAWTADIPEPLSPGPTIYYWHHSISLTYRSLTPAPSSSYPLSPQPEWPHLLLEKVTLRCTLPNQHESVLPSLAWRSSCFLLLVNGLSIFPDGKNRPSHWPQASTQSSSHSHTQPSLLAYPE